jgi:type II secretory pathway component PulJ
MSRDTNYTNFTETKTGILTQRRKGAKREEFNHGWTRILLRKDTSFGRQVDTDVGRGNSSQKKTKGTKSSNHRGTEAHSPFLSRAFSLIEILITVGLLSFIILGLLLMFNQVQRAFRSSTTQTDVMESGRSVMDMVARDLEEMAPWQLPYTNQMFFNHQSLNFMVGMTSDFGTPLKQDLIGTTGPTGPWRMNVVQRFFFTSKSNQTYTATGYRVIADYTNATGPVYSQLGTLYRYSVSTNKNWAGYLGTNYFVASQFTTNMHRIADGIVHLQLKVFDTNGVSMFGTNANSLMFWTFTNNFVGPGIFQPQAMYVPVQNAFVTNDWPVQGQPMIPNQQYMETWFYSNAVPAYVELEMGILEQHTLDRYRAIAEADVGAANNYLAKHAANVQVFRQRIPIRAVDYMAYR